MIIPEIAGAAVGSGAGSTIAADNPFLWSTNTGWIHAGSGDPANGFSYTNTGGTLEFDSD